MPSTLTITIVTPELQAAYNHFNKLLYEDVAEHLRADRLVPFEIKHTFQLGTIKMFEDRIKEYLPIMQKMMDSAPKSYKKE